MIDDFALLVSHGLLALAFWRLASRAALDSEAAGAAEPRPRFARREPPGRA